MENNTEKIKLTQSLPAKVGAQILLILLSILTAAYGAIVTLCVDQQWYSGSFFPANYAADIRTLVQYAYNARYWGIAIAAVGLICCVALLVFLCCAAGRRASSDGVRRNLLDKIPLDVYFAGVLLAVAGLCALCSEAAYYGGSIELLVACWTVCGILAELLLLALILSFATRVKLGGWWRNTLIYIVCMFCWRVIKRVWHWCVRTVRGINENLPIVWRTALFSLLAIFIEVLLTSALGHEAFYDILWFLYNLALFAALCFGALQMKSLKLSGEKLAAGDLSYQLDTNKMYWEFREHGNNLNSIANGMSRAVEERLKSERLKTELITNVSHDIKTPLTSIVNYVDLLQKEHTPEQETEYLEVLARQSKRLKKLTEDLVEASKASTGNMTVTLAPTNTLEIINQSVGEYSEKLSAGKLEAVVTMPDPPVSVMADGRLLWRVMDNLLNNVCKYALAGTRVYIDVTPEPEYGVISVKNISRAPLNITPEELMERFVRGDTSRNTEGSGLGLNIAKSLAELQNGMLTLHTDGDLFKAEIRLPRAG